MTAVPKVEAGYIPGQYAPGGRNRRSLALADNDHPLHAPGRPLEKFPGGDGESGEGHHHITLRREVKVPGTGGRHHTWILMLRCGGLLENLAQSCPADVVNDMMGSCAPGYARRYDE
ncbi:hypothetical protein PG996_004160 [Apiospora saccharicola]|uniref:Uncharacterized protein n=1 Tax=Apiospora saccharicola TaxID=335842 RepID=A0ABR1W671_9PEZI